MSTVGIMPDFSKKLFVATPSCRDWKAEFGNSIVRLSSHLTGKFIRGEIQGLLIGNQVTSLLSLGREILLETAFKSGSTHILWIDDDTKFETSAVDSLLSRDMDYVAANMVRKQFPIENIACGFDGKPVSSVCKSGIEEVFHVGLGMTLINLDVLREIPVPRFEIKWAPELKTYRGEDVFLCERLRANGVKLFIDHDASQLVSHIGDFYYETPKPAAERKVA